MARPRQPNSASPKYRLAGVDDRTIQQIDEYLEDKGITWQYFLRQLIKAWAQGKIKL